MQPNLKSDDYYEVLGVPRDASKASISKAYRSLSLIHHPDKNQDSKAQAEENFKIISEAYKTLSDPDKRKEYDQFGKHGASSGGGVSSDEAEALFRNLFGAGGGSGQMPAGGMPFIFNMQGGGGNMGAHTHGSAFRGTGIDIDSIFEGLSGRRGGYNNAARPLPAYAKPVGTSVVVRGLTTATIHNGKTGRVKGFDAAQGRYQVAFENCDDVLSLKPKNLTQQCSVEVTGLENKPELNGKLGDAFNYDATNDRYMVLLQQPPTAISLQRRNCILAEGTRVVLDGLSNKKFNGQMARILSIHRNDFRYTVQCQDGNQIKVQYDKVVC